MSNQVKYYSIIKYEWLPNTGDASKMRINYSIAEYEEDSKNKEDYSIVVKLARTAELIFDNESEKATAIIAYIQNEIESAIVRNSELSPEINITTYEKKFPPPMGKVDLVVGKWKKVMIENKFGFL